MVIQRFIIIGATIGGSCVLMIHVELAGNVLLNPGWPNLSKFATLWVLVAAGAVFGSMIGHFVGIAVRAFSKNKK